MGRIAGVADGTLRPNWPPGAAGTRGRARREHNDGDGMMLRRVRLLRAHAARSRPGRRGGRAALLLLLVAGLALVGPMAARPAAAQCAPPAVTLSASPRAALAGQPVTFSFSATAGGPVVAGVSCAAPPL